MCVLVCLLLVKLKFDNVACNFGMCTTASKYMLHMKDECHELALGLPPYTCGIQVQWIHIDKEMHHLAAGQLLLLLCD